jgi:hypothetical protein
VLTSTKVSSSSTRCLRGVARGAGGGMTALSHQVEHHEPKMGIHKSAVHAYRSKVPGPTQSPVVILRGRDTSPTISPVLLSPRWHDVIPRGIRHALERRREPRVGTRRGHFSRPAGVRGTSQHVNDHVSSESGVRVGQG